MRILIHPLLFVIIISWCNFVYCATMFSESNHSTTIHSHASTYFKHLYGQEGELHKNMFPNIKIMFITDHRKTGNNYASYEIHSDVFPDNIERIELDNCKVKPNIDLSNKSRLKYLKIRNCMPGILDANKFPVSLQYFRLYKSGKEKLEGTFPKSTKGISIEVQNKFYFSPNLFHGLEKLLSLNIIIMDDLDITLPKNLQDVVLRAKTIKTNTQYLKKLNTLQLYSSKTSFVITNKLPIGIKKLIVHGKNIVVEKNALTRLKELKYLDLSSTGGTITINDIVPILDLYKITENNTKFGWLNYFINIISDIIGYNWLKI